MATGNLFADAAPAPDERIEAIASTPGARVERIVCWGQSSPPGFWYDQADAEWVAVLRGRARLSLCDPDESVDMGPGDWILIGAHRRHRVDWTAPGEATVWLAVFLPEDAAGRRASAGQPLSAPPR
jgi:cupin 2 domain-containing protein